MTYDEASDSDARSREKKGRRVDGKKLLQQLDREVEFFRRRALLIAATATGLAAALFAAWVVAHDGSGMQLGSLALALLAALGAGVFAQRTEVRTGSLVFVVGQSLALAGVLFFSDSSLLPLGYLFITFSIVSAFLLGPTSSIWVGGAGAAVVLARAVVEMLGPGASAEQGSGLGSGAISLAGVEGIVVVLSAGAIFLLTREAARRQSLLAVGAHSSRDLNKEILSISSRLGAASGEIQAMMQEQTQAAMSQSSAVEETRQVLRSVADSAEEIVSAADTALGNAQVTYTNSERVAKNIKTLSGHTQDILSMLDSIKEVADRSDLLALNAALEGAKAGEVGRGFSLVANQMQRLAERVSSAVLDIQELTVDIRQATTATQLSMEEAMKLASATTEASQKISLITQQQRSGVSQVSTAMDDIVELTSHVASGTEQTITSTQDLQSLAETLMELVKETQGRESIH